MFSFLQPSRMSNDQIYALSLRSFSTRVSQILDCLEFKGGLSSSVSNNLRQGLKEPDYLRTVHHPGLSYLAFQLTQGSAEDLNKKLDSQDSVNRLLSYFIYPCSIYGIDFQCPVFCHSDGTIEIPGLKYVVRLNDVSESPNYIVITSKDTVSLMMDGNIIGTIYISGNVYTEETSISQTGINYYPKTYIKGSAIELELSDTSIFQYLRETKDAINVNNRILKGDFQSINFSANDQMFYESCINLIKEVWPEFHAEIMGHIKQMAIIDSDAFGGFTSNLLPDAVFLAHRPYDSLRVTENIIHECSHSRLNQLMEIDPVVMNDHEETYHSPWREDPRPMEGVYHGAFVFARIVVWLEKLYNYYPHKQIAERLKVVRFKLSDALQVIEKHGELSALGKHVLGEMSEIVSETVPQ